MFGSGHGFQAALGASSLRNRGFFFAGVASSRMNFAQRFSPRWNTRLSASVSSAALRAVSSRNSVKVLLETAAARCKVRLAVGVMHRSTRSERASGISVRQPLHDLAISGIGYQDMPR